jgi:hypothetical protein
MHAVNLSISIFTTNKVSSITTCTDSRRIQILHDNREDASPSGKKNSRSSHRERSKISLRSMARVLRSSRNSPSEMTVRLHFRTDAKSIQSG